MTNFNIKVISDTVCPWCYLGKKRLEKAIDIYKRTVPGGSTDTFTITWHPFYLDPSLPTVGVERGIFLQCRFGADRIAMMDARLKALGAAEGINFSLKGKIGNTRNAHRLVQLAKTKSNDVENKVISELFRAHFEHDQDVTSQDMLLAAGEKAGLDRTEIKQWLDEGKGGDAVDREVQEAYRQGVHGVPNFTINGRYRVEGAQDAETFVEDFLRAKQSAPDVSGKGSEGVSC